MRITERRIEHMWDSLGHLESIAEERCSAESEGDNQEGEELFSAVEGFRELLRRLSRRASK